MRPAALLIGIALLMACQDGRTEPNEAGDKPAQKNEGTYYSTAATPDELVANEKTTVVLSLLPGSGFHWNDEYPAKFALKAPAGVTLDKTEFSFKKKEIAVSQKSAQLEIPVTLAAAGEQAIEFKGSFSVCNDTSCKIMRDEVFTVTLKGK